MNAERDDDNDEQQDERGDHDERGVVGRVRAVLPVGAAREIWADTLRDHTSHVAASVERATAAASAFLATRIA